MEDDKTCNENSAGFDQFSGRRETDFSMDIYSVKLPSQVPEELRARADQVEAEINASSKNKMEKRSRGRQGFNNDKEDGEAEEQMLDEDTSKVTAQSSP